MILFSSSVITLDLHWLPSSAIPGHGFFYTQLSWVNVYYLNFWCSLLQTSISWTSCISISYVLYFSQNFMNKFSEFVVRIVSFPSKFISIVEDKNTTEIDRIVSHVKECTCQQTLARSSDYITFWDKEYLLLRGSRPCTYSASMRSIYVSTGSVRPFAYTLLFVVSQNSVFYMTSALCHSPVSESVSHLLWSWHRKPL